MRRRPGDLARYLIWAGVLMSADANRRHFGLPSTWVFHMLGNSATLLLPDLLRWLAGAGRALPAPAARRPRWAEPLAAAARDLIAENPRYVMYVAPLALGYIVSHPRFNIYKGAWGRARLAGFGLDSIPHASTAWGLTTLLLDAADALARQTCPATPLGRAAGWLQDHGALVSGLTLAVLSAAYEAAEWAIYRYEFDATGGDPDRMNMEWGVDDTLHDLGTNAAGWLAAIAFRRAWLAGAAPAGRAASPAPLA